MISPAVISLALRTSFFPAASVGAAIVGFCVVASVAFVGACVSFVVASVAFVGACVSFVVASVAFVGACVAFVVSCEEDVSSVFVSSSFTLVFTKTFIIWLAALKCAPIVAYSPVVS